MIHDQFSEDKTLSRSKRWRLRHPEKQKAAVASWRAKNPNYQKVWNAQHPEKLKEYDRLWNSLNPEKRASIYKKHDLKRKDRKSVEFKLRVQKLRDKIFEMYGQKCVHCGFSDRRALQLDHVKDDGAAHRRNMGNNVKIWKMAVSEYRPDLFQILCANCNWIKRAEAKLNKPWDIVKSKAAAM